jgi:NAD(P)-dependent dehydrogenase (short-subunit alcohol dehydrogenase family)
MNEMFDVKGKVIAITGGGGVLCGAMGKALAQAGAKVVLLDLSEEAAQKMAAQCGNGAVACKCDVLDRASVQAAAKFVKSSFGRVDVLINGAGGNKKEATCSAELSFFDISPEAIQWVFNLNVIGTIIPCQFFGKMMVDQGEGVILNISSMNAFRPLTNIAAYSAAKAAVSNFTQWLAVHMAHNYSKKIRVNAIAPGFFLTEQNRFLLTEEKTGVQTRRARQILDHTPMGEFGKPEDLIGTTIWLCSDAARFVDGVVIPIDGGFSAYSGV